MSSENQESEAQLESGEEKQDSQEKDSNPLKAEEAKLKAKYPNLGQKPGGSDFLMKRLQKGNLVTGDHIPTPQDLPQRKSSLVTSKLAG
ncbi:hypothetical protein JZ751_007251 [Albula glossodonta]|uniref:Endosulfine alpha n=1 Tax=Albula glossodonta TaxID=121402 RepID=A0A8T2N467_9TELE|nr:hypothetical protein JZ751_007251 [Albula glossodonta]